MWCKKVHMVSFFYDKQICIQVARTLWQKSLFRDFDWLHHKVGIFLTWRDKTGLVCVQKDGFRMFVTTVREFEDTGEPADIQ